MTEKSLIFRADSAGFSLIELLMVVTIIGIIASIAVPHLLRSKAAANEAVAISYMRSWSAAQELYHTNHGCYADDDNQLFDDGLIGGHDPANSHGYTFSLDVPPGSQYAWWGRASPDIPGETGTRWFYIDQTGVIRGSTSGAVNSNSPPL
jgi:prepilin-type N-terminal cleavage/methylation domain-containing protein